MQSWSSDREVEKLKTRKCRDCKIALTFESRDRRCPGCWDRWNAVHICLPKGDGGTEHTLCGVGITFSGGGNIEVPAKRVAYWNGEEWMRNEKGFPMRDDVPKPSCQPCRDAARAAKLPQFVEDTALPAIKVVDLGD